MLALNLLLIVKQFLQKKEVPDLFGYAQMVVVSGSMEPAVSVGDMVIIQTGAEYQTGDIITYYDGGAYVTHRLLARNGADYITKGDANNTQDEPVSGEQILGKVVLTIPKAGNVILFLRTPAGIVTLAALGYLLIMVPDWLEKKKEKKNRRNAGTDLGGCYESRRREGKTE